MQYTVYTNALRFVHRDVMAIHTNVMPYLFVHHQSNKVVSCCLAMLAADRNVRPVLNELLGPTGASLYVRAVSEYAKRGENISFYSMAVRVAHCGEILLGYQLRGVTYINPGKKRCKSESRPAKNVAISWSGITLVILSKKTVEHARRAEVLKEFAMYHATE